MPPFTVLEREIPAAMTAVEALALQLRSLMADGDLVPQRDRFAVELLAREALSNAVRHGCLGDASRAVSFRCRLGHLRAIVEVADPGEGFDWRGRAEMPLTDTESHGRGLTLFKLYASRTFFNPSGNRIVLIRNFQERNMSDQQEPADGTIALMNSGDLTAATVEQAREKMKSLLKPGVRNLTIDLGGASMVDSMGIGLLIQASNSLSRIGGTLTVVHASSELLDLFRSMRLDKRFTIQA
jgi:anti-anti-sigma factor